MTVVGLKLSRKRNAVSSLNGEVCRRMWHPLWPQREESEVPIGHITNGVHVKSWLASSMERLFVRHLGKQWEAMMSFPEFWRDIETVDDLELWEEHQLLRHNLVRFVRRRLNRRAERLGDAEALKAAATALDPNALTIGFSRRFATYKRATLLFTDLDRLDRLVNDPERPMQIVFAGKAHPADDGGKRLIQDIFNLGRDPRFAGKVCIVENYDISVGRHLVQGADIWLNNPERPREACGTSGQKVLLNGGLNCSIPDGWWAESADGRNGFLIGDGGEHVDHEIQRGRDAMALYELLENTVIPEFYERDEHGVPRAWVARMKHAIKTLGWRFNSDRMVKDYMEEMYLPAMSGTSCDLGNPRAEIIHSARFRNSG